MAMKTILERWYLTGFQCLQVSPCCISEQIFDCTSGTSISKTLLISPFDPAGMYEAARPNTFAEAVCSTGEKSYRTLNIRELDVSQKDSCLFVPSLPLSTRNQGGREMGLTVLVARGRWAWFRALHL